MTVKRVLLSFVLCAVASISLAFEIPNGSTDQYVQFVGMQSADPTAAFTGGTSFTVKYIVNGGTLTTMTTPTVTEKGDGCYVVLLDEAGATTIPDANDTANLLVEIIHSGMVTVWREAVIRESMATIEEVQEGRATLENQTTIIAVTDKVDTMLESDGASGYQFTELALENGPAAAEVDEEAIANAVGALAVPGSFASGQLGYIIGNTVALGEDAAAGLEYFFDVETPAKTMNDVGVAGSGLTAQQVWEYATRVLTALDEDTTTIDLNGSTIGTVTTLTNLPAATSDWLTAAAVKADAVTKIQNGLATPTNITAGTITTVTNLTNAPTNGDLTAAMKASVNAEVDAALNTAIPGSPTADSVNERIVAIYAYGAPPSAATIKTAFEADGSKLDHLWEMTEDDDGTRRYTADALEASPTGTGGFTETDRTTIETIIAWVKKISDQLRP